MNIVVRRVALILGLLSSWSLAQEEGLQQLGKVAFTEGPAWHPVTGNLYFSDIENNRIMRMDPTKTVHVYRTPSGRANGLLFDSEGRLHACEGCFEGGNRRVTRTELDGSITILTDRYEGKRYNSPNDLAMDSQGRIYFTDPRYRDRRTMEIFDEDGKGIEGVYRLDPDGNVTRIITHEVERPNGIAVSADDRVLYVCDNMNGAPTGNRKLWKFALKDDGSVDLESQELLFDWGTDRGPDGMAIGPDGLLYVTAGLNFPSPPNQTADKYKAGVYVISPEGELKDFIAVPMDMITNCTFGAPDGRTLYITAGHMIWCQQIK